MMICDKCKRESFIIYITKDHIKLCDKCYKLGRLSLGNYHTDRLGSSPGRPKQERS